MSTGFTQVTATHLQDATGTPIANATIYFSPVDNSGKSLSFRTGGTQGQTVSQPVSATVTNGAFSLVVADTTLTVPINIAYKVTCVDNVSGDCLLGNGYTCVQPYGATWSFDNYTPNLAGQVTVQTGPQGPPATFKGAYNTSTVYSLGDAVYNNDGSSYVSLSATNVGDTPGSSSQWALLAAKGATGNTGLTGAQGIPGVNSQVGNVSGTFGRQTFAGNGSTTSFAKPVSGVAAVYVNGLLNDPGADYTESSSTVTLSAAPLSSEQVTLLVFASLTRQSYTADGTTVTFAKPMTGTCTVYVGGLEQDTADYTETTSAITFNVAPASGLRVTLLFYPTN